MGTSIVWCSTTMAIREQLGSMDVGLKMAQDLAAIESLERRMWARCLALGGSVSGEHGCGMGKVRALREEWGGGGDRAHVAAQEVAWRRETWQSQVSLHVKRHHIGYRELGFGT